MATGLPGQPVCTAPLSQLTSEHVKPFQCCIHCYLWNVVPTIPKPKKDRRSTPASHHKPHGQPRPQQLQPIKPPSAPNTSDSEVSDGELQDSVVSKALSSRLRHQALVCLTSVFTVSITFYHPLSATLTSCLLQAIGPRTTFSYWLSFLPDGPRLPNSPPSILSCILRDPNHKARPVQINALFITSLLYTCSVGLQRSLCCVPCWKAPGPIWQLRMTTCNPADWPSPLSPLNWVAF